MDVTPLNYQMWEKMGYLDNPQQCGVLLFAKVYFVSFTLIVTFVIVNLFIAVILEGFDDSHKGVEQEIIRVCVEVRTHLLNC